MPAPSRFDLWAAAWGSFKRPTLCPGCAYRPALLGDVCGPCAAIRREHPVTALPAAGRRRPTPRRSPTTAPATVGEAALDALVDALAAHIAAHPTCPRCGRPTATLTAEPCPACVSELAAEREQRHQQEKARQRAWWTDHGQAWRTDREAAARDAQ